MDLEPEVSYPNIVPYTSYDARRDIYWDRADDGRQTCKPG